MNAGALTARLAARPTTRRAAVSEALGVAAVLAIPVVVAVSTAEPVPNPPSRETLNVISPQRLEVIQQRREAAKERRNAARRQRTLSQRSGRNRPVRPRPQRTPSSNRTDATDP